MEPIVLGKLTVKLADTPEEQMQAYELMKSVFEEDNNTPKNSVQLATDIKSYSICDILVAIDNDTKKVVATYRLTTPKHVKKLGKFFTEIEYEIENIKNYKDGKILEFSRACTHKDYRDNVTMMTLWKGLATYIFENDIKLMFGLPSLHGLNPDDYKMALSYLHHYHLAPKNLDGKCLQNNKYDYLPKEKLDKKQAYEEMPPLLKSYVRMGAYIGSGLFIDPDFNSIDLLLIVDFNHINPAYMKHFSRGLTDDENA